MSVSSRAELIVLFRAQKFLIATGLVSLGCTTLYTGERALGLGRLEIPQYQSLWRCIDW